jgi:uncharacterized protein (TIGR02145 family)
MKRLILFNVILLFLFGCDKDPIPTVTPSITTGVASNVLNTTATVSLSIADVSNSKEIGVLYSTSSISLSSTAQKTSISNLKSGDNSASLTDLFPGTTYYYKAYATDGYTSIYGEIKTFTTGGVAIVTDVDGNVYHYITIGTQIWMVENLKTTKYRDGTAIPNVTDQTIWTNLTTGAYCYYNNDVASYNALYGYLYNWYAVNTGMLAPTGWHVATDTEWTTLSTYLGGESVAGGKLKETGTNHWNSPNTGATNESGFSALPGGSRFSNGFSNVGDGGFWWSSTKRNDDYVWFRFLGYNYGNLYNSGGLKHLGFSVRCLRDN